MHCRFNPRRASVMLWLLIMFTWSLIKNFLLSRPGPVLAPLLELIPTHVSSGDYWAKWYKMHVLVEIGRLMGPLSRGMYTAHRCCCVLFMDSWGSTIMGYWGEWSAEWPAHISSAWSALHSVASGLMYDIKPQQRLIKCLLVLWGKWVWYNLLALQKI